jgi:dihydrofolate reductase
MKNELVLYIAMSLDGFIADERGSVDWLMEYDGDYDYTDFVKGVESVLMGRKTYEQICSFDVKYPYIDQKTYIVTSNKNLDRYDDHDLITEDIEKRIRGIKEKAKKNIWLIGGEKLITLCLEEMLIDRIILFIVPTLINSGIRLFNNLNRSNLVLINTKRYKNSMVKLEYLIK